MSCRFCWQLESRIRMEHPDPVRKLSANLYDIYHCCVYSEKTPDDGQRNCPKHVEFHSKNKFEKLVHLVGSVPSWSCSQAVSKPVWHIPLLCVQWKTPDDGQRNCPKHVEFHSKNKFEKLGYLVGFIIRNLSRCTVTWMSNSPIPLSSSHYKHRATPALFLFPVLILLHSFIPETELRTGTGLLLVSTGQKLIGMAGKGADEWVN